MATQSVLNATSLDFQLSGQTDVKLEPSLGALSFGGFGGAPVELLNIATPQTDGSAATKSYVDSAINGVHWLPSVCVKAPGNVSVTSAPATIDGWTLLAGHRILLDQQTTTTEDGIWEFVSAGAALTRTADAKVGEDLAAKAVFVEKGTLYADSGWVCTDNSGSGVVGTDDLTFARFSGLSDVNAGSGLSKTGNQLDVNVDDSSLEISTDTLRVKASGVTNAMLSNSSVTITAGDGLATTSGTVALGASATLSVNVDNSTLEIDTDTVRVKADGVDTTHVDWGTTGNQVNAEHVPLTTHVWTQVSAPTDLQDLGEKLDATINDIVGGGNAVTLSNGISTRGGTGVVDLAVDDVGIEVSGVVGSDFIQLKDAGIVDAKIATGTITNAKLANSGVTVTAGDGLATTSSSIALGSSATLSVNVDDSTIEISTDALQLKDAGIVDAKIATGTITNAKLANSGVTVTAGTGLSTGGAVSLGGSVTLDVDFSEVMRLSTNQTAAGVKTFSDTTDATSATTGAVVIAGGLGVTKKIYTNDTVTCDSVINTSDRSLKSDIVDLKLDGRFDRLAPKQYTMKGHKQYGLIAQDVQKLYPDVVHMNGNGKLALDYRGIYSLLLQDHLELKREVHSLRQQLGLSPRSRARL